MDFPIDLRPSSVWVRGIEEIKQDVILLLTNSVGSFLQSGKIGAKFSVHCQDDVMVEEGIMQTLSQIPYVTLERLVVQLPNIGIWLRYNSEDFSIKIDVDKL